MLWNQEAGYVAKPKLLGNTWSIYKVKSSKIAPDSIKARHILVSSQSKTPERAEEIIDSHKIRDWVHKIDVQNAILNDMEDYLFSVKGRYNLEFSMEELDNVMQLLMNVAKRREGYGQ